MSSFNYFSAILCFTSLSFPVAPHSESVISKSMRKFPLTLGNEIIEVKKVRNLEKLTIDIVSTSHRVKSASDLVKLEDNEKLAERRKYGAISAELRETFESLSASDSLEVIVTPLMPNMTLMDKTSHSNAELKEHTRMVLSLSKPEVSLETIFKRHGMKNIADAKTASGGFEKDPVVKLSKAQLELLKQDPNILSIRKRESYAPSSQPFSSLANSAYNPASEMPSDALGSGIEVATIEKGSALNLRYPDGSLVPNGNLVGCANLNTSRIDETVSQLKIQTVKPTLTYDWTFWEHSQQTLRCLMHAAPKATLFHRGHEFTEPSYDGFGISSWIVENDIRTVSLSYARAPANPLCPLVDQTKAYDANWGEFLLMDQMALQWPFPFFSNPAGNQGLQFEVNWQSYNSMSVGNVQHVNLNHYQFLPNNNSILDPCSRGGAVSQARNPKARYGGLELMPANSLYSYGSGDREMPYILAPGITPDNQSMTDACVPQPIWSGTSYSAPNLSGIAACVISSNRNVMINWPEKVRAVLLATAQNVDGGEWNSNVDGNDGAGVVSGAKAVKFARNHTEVNPGEAAVIDGIGAAAITAENFDTSPYLKYNIKIPATKPSGYHLRIVLTWGSNPVTQNPDGSPAMDNRLSDLDLFFHKPTEQPVNASASSVSYNGNVEIIDVPASALTANATYCASIRKLVNRIPAGNFFYYSIVWTWAKDHAL
ncbi:MAG TPA: S8 family serine peptidase [Fibrobacteria bacterium]|nr:S8 family serine peptidase [Fibrobacteria bacterium]